VILTLALRGQVVTDLLEDQRDVHRVGHRAAHPPIGEKRIAAVHVVPNVGKRPLGAPSLVPDLAERIRVRLQGELLWSQSGDAIHVLLLERQKSHVPIRDDPKNDPLEIRLLPPVILPSLDDDLVVLLPLDEPIGPAAHRLAGLTVVVIAGHQVRMFGLFFLEKVLGDDREEKVPS